MTTTAATLQAFRPGEVVQDGRRDASATRRALNLAGVSTAFVGRLKGPATAIDTAVR